MRGMFSLFHKRKLRQHEAFIKKETQRMLKDLDWKIKEYEVRHRLWSGHGPSSQVIADEVRADLEEAKALFHNLATSPEEYFTKAQNALARYALEDTVVVTRAKLRVLVWNADERRHLKTEEIVAFVRTGDLPDDLGTQERNTLMRPEAQEAADKLATTMETLEKIKFESSGLKDWPWCDCARPKQRYDNDTDTFYSRCCGRPNWRKPKLEMVTSEEFRNWLPD